jgi:hypothetical protein
VIDTGKGLVRGAGPSCPSSTDDLFLLVYAYQEASWLVRAKRGDYGFGLPVEIAIKVCGGRFSRTVG